MNPYYESLAQKRSDVQSAGQLMYLKKGGGMTVAEKIQLENVKYNHKRKLKEVELEYKAIMHNNEMLQKSLIKVFK
ncbi:MAG: hypothetical protein ACOH2V_01235 [Candidatus Saccharimonadaceae bacterium]